MVRVQRPPRSAMSVGRSDFGEECEINTFVRSSLWSSQIGDHGKEIIITVGLETGEDRRRVTSIRVKFFD